MAIKTYDRLSHVYDLLAGSSEMPFINLGLELLRVEPGESVLEIGCGTGKALVELCQQVTKKGNVYGLDLSYGMLQAASKRLTEIRYLENAPLICGDGASLPYASGVFSSVFMSFTLELFDTPEIPLVLAESWRVLEPDGRIGVVAMLKPIQASLIVRLYEWLHAHFPTYVDCRPIIAGEMIRSAGFRLEKQLVKSMWGLPVELLLARKG